MPVIETESIVLKSHNLADADRIVVLFTRDQGVVRGVAKGIKRLTSKYGSTFEPFSLVNLTYFQKEDRELVSIQQGELIRSGFNSASSPEVLSCFSYIADLLLAFVPPNDPNEKMFRMVRACYELKRLTPETIPSLQAYFELWLLRLGGFLPDWSSCYTCRRTLDITQNPGIDTAHHLICTTCQGERRLQAAPFGWFQVFHNVQKLPPAEYIAIPEHAARSIEVSKTFRRIIERSLDRPISTGHVATARFTGP
jgi:DNA repair protein RecO (recombination protein O)